MGILASQHLRKMNRKLLRLQFRFKSQLPAQSEAEQSSWDHHFICELLQAPWPRNLCHENRIEKPDKARVTVVGKLAT